MIRRTKGLVWAGSAGTHFDEVKADGVISVHGDGAFVLRDDLQTLQGSAVTLRQQIRTDKHTHTHVVGGRSRIGGGG